MAQAVDGGDANLSHVRAAAQRLGGGHEPLPQFAGGRFAEGAENQLCWSDQPQEQQVRGPQHQAARLARARSGQPKQRAGAVPDEPQLLRVQLRMPAQDFGMNVMVPWGHDGSPRSGDSPDRGLWRLDGAPRRKRPRLISSQSGS